MAACGSAAPESELLARAIDSIELTLERCDPEILCSGSPAQRQKRAGALRHPQDLRELYAASERALSVQLAVLRNPDCSPDLLGEVLREELPAARRGGGLAQWRAQQRSLWVVIHPSLSAENAEWAATHSPTQVTSLVLGALLLSHSLSEPSRRSLLRELVALRRESWVWGSLIAASVGGLSDAHNLGVFSLLGEDLLGDLDQVRAEFNRDCWAQLSHLRLGWEWQRAREEVGIRPLRRTARVIEAAAAARAPGAAAAACAA